MSNGCEIKKAQIDRLTVGIERLCALLEAPLSHGQRASVPAGPIDPKTEDRFALRPGPDGVYFIEGRMIPVRKDSPNDVGAVDDSQPVIGVHD